MSGWLRWTLKEINCHRGGRGGYSKDMFLTPRFEKGPAEVLRALFSADPDQVREAVDFQRESFRATYGRYPEEGIKVKGETDDSQ